MKKIACVLLLLLLAACAGKAVDVPAGAGGSTPGQMTLTSPAFQNGEAIPTVYTCKGDDLSMALEWSQPPQGAQSLALVMDDPDAPVGTWVHWVVYNLPPGTRGLAEGAARAKASSSLPEGALAGMNSWKRADYGGPCPPSGTHRYYFRIYALDIALAEAGLDKAGLFKAMDGHVLAQGEIMGKFGE
jgi:Raf kinase inhibitor-like YbhB/YbcL family protein